MKPCLTVFLFISISILLGVSHGSSETDEDRHHRPRKYGYVVGVLNYKGKNIDLYYSCFNSTVPVGDDLRRDHPHLFKHRPIKYRKLDNGPMMELDPNREDETGEPYDEGSRYYCTMYFRDRKTKKKSKATAYNILFWEKVAKENCQEFATHYYCLWMVKRKGMELISTR